MVANNATLTNLPKAPVCTRCGGELSLITLDDGRIRSCRQCGLKQPSGIGAPVPSEREPLPVSPNPADWQHEVRRQIKVAIARYGAADEARREAERLVAALAAYGATDIPALPWKAPKGSSAGNANGGGKGVPRNWGTCELCGVALSGVALSGAASLRLTETGRVCKNEAACATRRGHTPEPQPERDDQAPAAAEA